MRKGVITLGVAFFATTACDTSRPLRHRPDSGCESQSGELSIDSTCEAVRCGGALARSSCELTVELQGCSDLVLRGARSGDDEWVFEPSPKGDCKEVAAPSGALFSIECAAGPKTCRYDMYQDIAPLEIETATITVLSSTLRFPPFFPEDPLGGLSAHFGYLSSFVVLQDRVVVSSHRGEIGTSHCDDPLPSSFHSFDLETLMPLDVVDGPPCVQRMAPDPNGAEFIAIFGPATSHVARFDRSGRMIGPEVPLGFPDVDEYRHGVALSVSNDWIHVVGGRQLDEAYARLLVLDPRTLATVTTSEMVLGKARSGLDLGQLGFALSDSILDTILFFDRRTAAGTAGIALLGVRPISREAGFLAKSGSDLFLSTSGSNGGVWLIEDLSEMISTMTPIVFYERAAMPWAAIELPSDRSLMLVGLVDSDTNAAARIALLNASEKRFLPGSKVIGEGAVAEMREDHRGRIWALMPWSAKLARITPR